MRRCPQQIIREQVDKVFRLPLKHDTLQNKKANGIQVVVTYKSAFRNLSSGVG